MRYWIVALAAGLSLPGIAMAQGAHSEASATPDRPRSEAALARYPQPVRVGDLVGRSVIEDTQQQAVLGRVVAVTRIVDGRRGILVERRGFLGFGERRVVVPMEAMALLGHLIVLKDLSPMDFVMLPDAPRQLDLLALDATVRMGLARN